MSLKNINLNKYMNKYSRLYAEKAIRLTKEFRKDRNVKAIILTGSSGLNIADKYSDLDVVIYFTGNIPKSFFLNEKRDAISRGGNILDDFTKHGFAVYKFIEEGKCDFAFDTVSRFENIVRNVFIHFSTNETELQKINGFLNSTPLYGNKWVESWKKKLINYPMGLSEMVIRHNMGFFHNLWEVEHLAIGRKDDFFFYELMTKSLKRVINILCGINRIYLPGKMKHIMQTVNEMKIKPVGLKKCVKGFYSVNKSILLDELTRIVEKTLLLSEKDFPEVKTERSRKLLYMKHKIGLSTGRNACATGK